MKLRDKLRIRVFATLKERDFEDLVALYLERVPDYERVPPDHFKAFLAKQHSAKSPRDFCQRLRHHEPTHVLLVARTSHEICGFIKAIFIPEQQYLFLAYLVSSKGSTHEERNVANQLLSKLFSLCQEGMVRRLVFEVCIDSTSRTHEAKTRLFRHYARAHSLRVMQIEAPYYQPEICAFDVGACGKTAAQLCVIDISAPIQPRPSTINKADFIALVSSIYRNIYLESFRLADPDSAESYAAFLDQLSVELSNELKQEAVGLK